jgi:hypothetical protein
LILRSCGPVLHDFSQPRLVAGPALKAERAKVALQDVRVSNLLAAGVDVVTVSKTLGPCERAHHACDLRACDTERATWGRRRFGASYGAEWKQNGNTRLRNGLRSLIECT